MRDVEQQILDQAWPTNEEAQQAWNTFQQIKDAIQDGSGLEARLMGSLAKRTFLAGDKDLDIFVFFPQDTSEDELEQRGLEIGQQVFEQFDGQHHTEYAEHPYTQGVIDGFDVEIVPAYDIDDPSEMRSSVDRTPLHTEWVNDQLDEQQKQQVVLLKAFLKGRELYGSTLKIRGFSGYLCELLIAEHGSFNDLLQAAVDWPKEHVIDIADHHPDGLPDALEDRFSNEDLVVVDPVDPERNVASVLSSDNHARFIHQAWQYLQEPSVDAFTPDRPTVDSDALQQEIDARGETLVVSFPKPDQVDDILYPQLRRLMRRIRDELGDNDFQLFEDGFHVSDDTVRLVFDLAVAQLPHRRKHQGPPVFRNQDHMDEFTSAYDTVWVEDGRLQSIVQRDHTDAEALLDDLLSGDLVEKGVPEGLAPQVEQREIGAPDLEGEDWLRALHSILHVPGKDS